MMFETAETGATIEKAAFERRAPELRVELVNAQYDLMSADFPVIIVLDGDDWRGVQDTLDGISDWMDTRYIRIHAMDDPREEDRLRPAFFPFWRCLPGKGQLAIFSNAWSVGAVRDRLKGDLDKKHFERHLLQIRRFERDQVSEGALLLKFWLHLPKKELKRSIKKANQGKNHRGAWKLSPGAELLYENFDEMIRYSQRLIEQTNEASSTWQIIESTDRRYVAMTIGETIHQAIRARLDAPSVSSTPSYPARARATQASSILRTSGTP
jgi:polyphosphate kinase 2 (PPK2 family)